MKKNSGWRLKQTQVMSAGNGFGAPVYLKFLKNPAIVSFDRIQGEVQALTLAEPGGFIRLFVDNGEPMRLLILDFKSWLNKQSSDRAHPLTYYIDKILIAFAPHEVVLGSTTINPQSELIEPLSQRELEVLQLICQGLSNNEICKQLYLALDTVKGHNRRIYGKLPVQRRTEVVAKARSLNILPRPN